MEYNAFPKDGRFYKGNLHTHSTLSDGRMSPEEARDAYRAKGYDFLALTDHCVYGVHEELSLPDFLMVPGVELDVSFDPKCHHIVAIGGPDTGFGHGQRFERPKPYAGPLAAQRIIDTINAAGNLALYAHPRWSHVMLNDFDTLTGLWGVEVMNWGCEVDDHSGDSEIYLDQLWQSGSRAFIAGTDDWHKAKLDKGGAFVCVKAAELTLPAIFDALKNGHFYASTGPEIYSVTMDCGMLTVICSPCDRVYLVTFPGPGDGVHAGDAPLTQATFEVGKHARYVRIQCVDARGMCAWSQPIFFP